MFSPVLIVDAKQAFVNQFFWNIVIWNDYATKDIVH